MEEKEIIERIVQTEQSTKSAHHRIDEVETEIKENRELTVAVKEIATEMKYLREEQASMNKRLKEIEDKPLKEYEDTKKAISKQIISFVIGIILTFIAFKLGLKDLL